jgi:pimeloyl-ACP methyl ester carboxylesterase
MGLLCFATCSIGTWYVGVPKNGTEEYLPDLPGLRPPGTPAYRAVGTESYQREPIVDVDRRTEQDRTAGGEQIVGAGRGIQLCYERLGPAEGEPLLLIAGLGQQLHTWPDGFCEGLVARGFCVIRFDNRDVGRSTHLDFPPPNPVALLRGRVGPQQYRLADMAADTAGLLDALGLTSVHVVGASMGGMIAQTLAARCPDRVRSLTSVMSNTGARRVGRPALSTWRYLAGRPARTREEAAQRAVRLFRHVGSQGFPFDADWVRTTAGRSWDRDPDGRGVARQLAAIVASGDRTAELRNVTAPTVVVHGDRDRMVHHSGGRATAAAIPGARLETVSGMGHDLPAAAWPRLINVIAANADRWAALRGSAPTRPDNSRGSKDAQVPA